VGTTICPSMDTSVRRRWALNQNLWASNSDLA
jgi:hypothetical protein